MEEYAREPCPWRIVDDCGGAFTMGAIGGGVFQSIKGFRNAPVLLLLEFMSNKSSDQY
uniref:Translocase of inner mitochondrial membrane 17 homolog B (yeast) n=1 Tax=Pygocentrus nattereri TaxID=42514 RepID=A0AAR2LQE5_PYGNA